MIRGGSTSPGFLWVLGTRQRTKCGSQLCSVIISSVRDTRYTEETVLPPPPFFFFLPSSLGAAVGWPGWSLHSHTRSSHLEVDLKISTTVSLTGSLFFSSQLVTL